MICQLLTLFVVTDKMIMYREFRRISIVIIVNVEIFCSELQELMRRFTKYDILFFKSCK